MLQMASEIRINVRTTPDIKRDIEIAARLRGLTVSSLVNSLAVKAIREEKDREPKAFETAEASKSKLRPQQRIAIEPGGKAGEQIDNKKKKAS